VHVARPSTAREILDSLGISPSEVRAALKAIDA
jgi:DNA-binding CsgD family transcriptional regulator